MTIMKPNPNTDNSTYNSVITDAMKGMQPLKRPQAKKKAKPVQIHQELFHNNKLNQMKRHILNDEKNNEAGLKQEMQERMDTILNLVNR